MDTVCICINISTHDLTRRSTNVWWNVYYKWMYFNSRPHEEVDFTEIFLSFTISISTHDLTRRSTIYRIWYVDSTSISTHDLTRRSTIFHVKFLMFSFISTHDLTRRSTRAYSSLTCLTCTFQLTTSRGGRQQFHTTLRHLKLSFLCLFYIFEHFLLY